ncbi:hypothetical protein E2C01_024703 [Portunus trituberculatus]|uniref:Uncharacterized protein n=1 Tax=Portunus trituberculatus TaxID=210409 RepID=A0A5B7EEF6_PORTR|nr:hypothetical protein [Portunus trituberculatus]
MRRETLCSSDARRKELNKPRRILRRPHTSPASLFFSFPQHSLDSRRIGLRAPEEWKRIVRCWSKSITKIQVSRPRISLPSLSPPRCRLRDQRGRGPLWERSEFGKQQAAPAALSQPRSITVHRRAATVTAAAASQQAPGPAWPPGLPFLTLSWELIDDLKYRACFRFSLEVST